MSRITKLSLTATPTAENWLRQDVGTITTSIGQGTTHDSTTLTITSVTKSSSPGYWDVTMNTNEGANFVVGDALWDEHSTPRKYLVTSISGDVLTVLDSNSSGEPDNSGTSNAAAKRYYNGSTPLADWESELDDTDLYVSGDDAVGECYNDSVFTEGNVSHSSGGTVNLNASKLTAAETERHDGTSNSGAGWANATAGPMMRLINTIVDIEISWLEFYKSSDPNTTTTMVSLDSNSPIYTIRNNIIRDCRITFGTMKGIHVFGSDHNIMNNFVYNLEQDYPNASSVYGMTTAGGNASYYNNTVANIRCNQGTGGSYGMSTGAFSTLTNCISMDAGGTSTGAQENFAANTTPTFSMSEDTTADGANCLTNKVYADQFVSTASGSEDLHLKAGSDAIGAGTDLGTTPDGVEIDINGFDRNSIDVSWDIGAHQFTTSAAVLRAVFTQFVF